jgi:hypothetical protein
LRSGFADFGMLPYQSNYPKIIRVRSFGNMLKPRWIVGAEPLDQ